MSLFDDDRPQKKTAHEIGSDLSLLSVGELSARIDLLRAVRVSDRKRQRRAQAVRRPKACSVDPRGGPALPKRHSRRRNDNRVNRPLNLACYYLHIRSFRVQTFHPFGYESDFFPCLP